MPLRLAFALAIALASSAAHADASAKVKAAVTQSFTGFISSLATDQPALSGLEAFLPPFLASNALPDATTSSACSMTRGSWCSASASPAAGRRRGSPPRSRRRA